MNYRRNCNAKSSLVLPRSASIQEDRPAAKHQRSGTRFAEAEPVLPAPGGILQVEM